jgi:hypothetical protein
MGAIALALVLFQPPSEAQVKVTFGRKKPVTDKNSEARKELGLDRNTAPLIIDKDLAAKVHTVAILTIAGPPKVSIGVKSADATALLAHAEAQLVSLLTRGRIHRATAG